MELEVLFGKSALKLDIPSSFTTGTFAPRAAHDLFDAARFRDEYEDAGLSRHLDVLNPLIVVNDAYRNTPTALLLDWLDRADKRLLERSQFLIATGSHPKPTAEQLRRVFGDRYETLQNRIRAHDARDRSSMREVGTDSFGETVRLHRALLEADAILAVGSVEPHYFAGYTGGRKSIFPGLTDLATIERNHNLANSLDAEPMRLSGNPVAEHLTQLMGLVDRSHLFGVQAVLDASGHPAYVYCGSLPDAFARAVKAAETTFAHQVERPYDIVLCEVLPPLDSSLYQVQKALENCQAAVRDGGTIVLISACSEGVGSPYFVEQAEKWDRHANRPRDGVLRFGSHKLSRVIAHSRRINVLLHSTLPHDTVRSVFYEPLDNLQEFLYLGQHENRESRLAVVYDAGNTVLTM